MEKGLREFFNKNQVVYLGEHERKEHEKALIIVLRTFADKIEQGEIQLNNLSIYKSEPPFSLKTKSYMLTDFQYGSNFKIDISA